MKVFDSLPIKLKVILIIMASSLVGLCLAVGGVFVYDQYMLKQSMQQEINILGGVIANRSTAALSFNDPQLAEENLAALQAQPAVILACIYKADNTIFARYHNSKHASSHCADTLQPQEHAFVADTLRVFTPIELNQERLGTVAILLSTQEIQRRLRQYGLLMIGVVAIVSLIVYAFSNLLQKPLLQPLLQLTDTARAIAKHKDYSPRVHKRNNDEIGVLVDAFNSMLEQIALREQERDDAEWELQQHREHLEELVAERTSEMESFCYSVSHDLRTPLRAINGYSQIVMEDYGSKLDNTGRENLMRVRQASVRMGELIDDLLNLSRTSRHHMTLEPVNISDIAKDIAFRLQLEQPEREVDIRFADGLSAMADPHLIRIALENLIGNAWKYTAKKPHSVVELGIESDHEESVYYVRDNGAGFDMTYIDRMFGPFQRLHTHDEFEGSGIGLAIVLRIIQRHGGRIWAQGVVGQGATFYFTLHSQRVAQAIQPASQIS